MTERSTSIREGDWISMTGRMFPILAKGLATNVDGVSAMAIHGYPTISHNL